MQGHLVVSRVLATYIVPARPGGSKIEIRCAGLALRRPDRAWRAPGRKQQVRQLITQLSLTGEAGVTILIVDPATALRPFRSEVRLVRSIGGVLLGVVGWAATAILGNWVLRVVLPGYSRVEEAMAFTFPMQIGRLTLGLVASLAAGALCAFVAGPRRVPPGVLGAIMVALFLPVHYGLWDKFPVWYHLFFLITLAPAVLVGALLVRQVAGSTASSGSEQEAEPHLQSDA
jgi:hypothetical protein